MSNASLGYEPRTTQEKLRVAEALEGLPRLRGALASGVLGWCAIRELTSVAAPDTEEAWLEAARSKTLRELEALVADKSPGDAPDAPGGRAPRWHVLRFEVSADTFATFREAMQSLERAAGGRMGHDALLLAMARQVLGRPSDAGRSSYQVSLHVCSECGRGEQVATGELVPVDSAVVEMAGCDAQQLGDHGTDRNQFADEVGGCLRRVLGGPGLQMVARPGVRPRLAEGRQAPLSSRVGARCCGCPKARRVSKMAAIGLAASSAAAARGCVTCGPVTRNERYHFP